MQKVPTADRPYAEPISVSPDQQVRQVTDLEAELDEASGAVLMQLRDPKNDREFAFVLSPPAAAQLSRRLRKAVRQYLRSAG